uniref:PDZ and LIM domain protein Zasp n=1 Tax=Parastrongyloides trichosuri TaxID=131310 RepID=A0A0N4ZIS1_PARTI
MNSKEMVTVRMNRADLSTPWGFQVKSPGIVSKIDGGSLADRAGIQSGDIISEIQGENINDFERLKYFLNLPSHEIELVIFRNMTSTRLWKPTIIDKNESTTFQQPIEHSTPGVKVNLEHKPMTEDPLTNGFNTSAKPFTPSSQNIHDNVGGQKIIGSTASHSVKAEQYLKETGGLFGTDPNAKNAFIHKNNQPSYLNSETLKLIQEDDKREKREKTPKAINNNAYRHESCGPLGSVGSGNLNPNLPICFICGRNILGLVCRAFDVNVHADCFSCTTCGSNLKNMGHHFVNSKFYCDVHGRQVKSLSQQQTSPRMSKSMHEHVTIQCKHFRTNNSTTSNIMPQHELSRRYYQPDIMTRQPILAERQNDEIIKNYSTNYSSVVNDTRKNITPHYGSASKNDHGNLNVIVDSKSKETSQSYVNKRSPLPKEIRIATSKFLSKSNRLPNWPPTESCATSPKKYWSLHLDPYTPKENKSLLDLVAENDTEIKRQHSSLSDIDVGPLKILSPHPMVNLNGTSNDIKINNNSLTPPAISPRRSKKKVTQKKVVVEKQSYNFIPIKHDKEDESQSSLNNLPEIVTTIVPADHNNLKVEKHLRWVETPEIIEETDIITDESFSDYKINDDEEDDYEDIEADESDCVEDEQEQWMREELEEYRKEKELEMTSNKGKDNTNNLEYNTEASILESMKNLDIQQNKLTELVENAQKLLQNLDSKSPIPKASETDTIIHEDNNNATKKLIEETRLEVEKMKEELRERSIILTNEEYMPGGSVNDKIDYSKEKSVFSEYKSIKYETPADKLCEFIKQTILEGKISSSPQSMSNECLDIHHQQTRYSNMNFQPMEDNNNSYYSSQRNYKSEKTIQNQYSGVNLHENRIPYCSQCRNEIHGAFVMTGGHTYCPEHFICANISCSRKLVDVGFVEEKGQRYCEECFEKLIAPVCAKCSKPVTGDCLNALQKQFHPQCFTCAHCMKPFGNAAFFMENGKPYCERDWNILFTTKCVSCKFPIEAGDRWVEALGSSFHSNCFSCIVCHVNLEGQSFYAKNNQPYCRMHA